MLNLILRFGPGKGKPFTDAYQQPVRSETDACFVKLRCMSRLGGSVAILTLWMSGFSLPVCCQAGGEGVNSAHKIQGAEPASRSFLLSCRPTELQVQAAWPSNQEVRDEA